MDITSQYDAKEEILTVQIYPTQVYQFFDVPKKVNKKFEKAEDRILFYIKKIKEQFDHQISE